MRDEFNKQMKKLKQQVEKTKTENRKLNETNAKLQDEVDSLWAMMDEMTKSDIANWTHLLDQLEADTAERALMVTKKKADAFRVLNWPAGFHFSCGAAYLMSNY